MSGTTSPALPVKIYVVQTNTKVIKRCLLMTTDPGDLVFDPTCGSRNDRLRRRAVGTALDHLRYVARRPSLSRSSA